MPLTSQLHSPEHIIKAEVLLVALAKGLALDAPGKQPLPSGHTIRLQVGQLLCSAVWDAIKHVWCTSSILYAGGAARPGEVPRPLLCLLEPAELHAAVTLVAGAAPGAAPVPTALATLKVLVQNTPLLAFVEAGGTVSTGQTGAAANNAAGAQAPASAAPGQEAAPSAAPATAGAGGAAPAVEAAKSSASSGSGSQPAGAAAGPSAATAQSQQQETAKLAAEWKLRVVHAGLELPSRVVSNVAFVTEDYVPVQVLVVEVEVDLGPLSMHPGPNTTTPQMMVAVADRLAAAISPAAAVAAAPAGALTHLRRLLALELCFRDTAVCSLPIPAALSVPQLLVDLSARTSAGVLLEAAHPGDYPGLVGTSGSVRVLDPRSYQTQYASLPASEVSGASHASYVTVASSASELLPPPLMIGHVAAIRSSAPDSLNRSAPASSIVIGMQSISSREEGLAPAPVIEGAGAAVPQHGTGAISSDLPISSDMPQTGGVSTHLQVSPGGMQPVQLQQQQQRQLAGLHGGGMTYAQPVRPGVHVAGGAPFAAPVAGRGTAAALAESLHSQSQMCLAAPLPAAAAGAAAAAAAAAVKPGDSNPRNAAYALGSHAACGTVDGAMGTAPNPTGARGPAFEAAAAVAAGRPMPWLQQHPHMRHLNGLDSAECSEYQTALSSM